MATSEQLLRRAEAHYFAHRFDNALADCREILAADAWHAEALALLGSSLAELGRNEDAADFLGRAVQAKPGQAAYHNNLGVVLHSLNKLDAARARFESAAEIDAGYADPLYNLAKLFRQLERDDEALETYEKVLAIDPGRADALINIGNIFFDQGRLDDAVASYTKAADIAGRDIERSRAWVNAGNALRRKGDAEGAIAAYDQALAIDDHDGLAIKRALTLPVIPRSGDHIAAVRAQFEARIAELLGRPLAVADPAMETSTTTFFLAYHGYGDRKLQELTAALHLKASPSLAFTAPHAASPRPAKGRIKVGFVSAYFRRHSIGRLMHGFIAHLSRDKFAVTVFTFAGPADEISRSIAENADHLVTLPNDVDEARHKIAAATMDILFYADLGMDIRTYFLAFARLAPVQCVTWGHPDTTGIPNVDYFVSSDLLEPAGAQAQYSESLYRLKTLPTYYPRPAPPLPRGRAELGLPRDGRVYLCPQTIIKFHPDFDILAGEILRRDAAAEIVLIEGPVAAWSDQVLERMRESIADVWARVRVIGRVSPEDFLALFAAADVVLDTPHFSGGNTSYESFAMGKPVVTLDGALMRGRVTAAQYRIMGIAGMTAKSLVEMAAIAVRLGTDAEFRAAMEKRVADNCHRLFDDMEAVHELERFFAWANGRVSGGG